MSKVHVLLLVFACMPAIHGHAQEPPILDGAAEKDSQEPDRTSSSSNATSFVEMEGKLGVFDDGRIEVRMPKGWKESANDENNAKNLEKNLARMSGTGTQRIPGIQFKAREYDGCDKLSVSRESILSAFVRMRSNELPKEKDSRGSFKVEPISIRGFHGAEYAYTVHLGGKSYERLVLETCVEGRLYTLELTTLKGMREESRPALYSVAAALGFPRKADTPSAADDGGLRESVKKE
jgi:hypothetical protein